MGEIEVIQFFPFFVFWENLNFSSRLQRAILEEKSSSHHTNDHVSII